MVAWKVGVKPAEQAFSRKGDQGGAGEIEPDQDAPAG
jgi:hypothetical protein